MNKHKVSKGLYSAIGVALLLGSVFGCQTAVFQGSRPYSAESADETGRAVDALEDAPDNFDWSDPSDTGGGTRGGALEHVPQGYFEGDFISQPLLFAA